VDDLEQLEREDLPIISLCFRYMHILSYSVCGPNNRVRFIKCERKDA
jgi:hypothetical protein